MKSARIIYRPNRESLENTRCIEEYTRHFWWRIFQRNIPLLIANMTVEFGRKIFDGSAYIFELDGRTVNRISQMGIDCKLFKGLRVVLSPYGKALTAYLGEAN
jgi:hypothetical protein